MLHASPDVHVVLQVCRFDGDAMVHAIHFAGGKAKSYCNHWIRTQRYLMEKAAGFNLLMRVRSPPVRGIWKVL